MLLQLAYCFSEPIIDIDYMPSIPNDRQKDVMRMEYVSNQRLGCGHSKKERASFSMIKT